MEERVRFDPDEPRDLDEYNDQDQRDYDSKLHQSCRDDIFTRRVRPTSVVMMLIFFVFIVLADGNLGHFKVNPGYYPIIETVIATMIIAYFGSRGFEKSVRSWERGQYHASRSYERRNFRRPSVRDDYEEGPPDREYD
jgi:hypothetical protein